MGGSFPTLINSVDRQEKKRKKEKQKRRKKRKNKKKKKKDRAVRETKNGEKKKERHFPSRSPVNQRSKRVGARDKVGPRDESYALVPETGGFITFQKVWVFSYTGFLFT